MSTSYDYDLFVIGAGSGGVRLARMSASKGARVAVAEDRYLGGTCVNVGCVPKKLFVYASHVNEELEDGQGYGWSNTGDLNFDWNTLRENKDTEINRLNGIYQRLLEGSGATIINGRARFVDQHTVCVEGKNYTAERIVIATGGWPYIPDIPGRELAIDSNAFFYLDELPESAVVVGGGYIAVEFAGILNGLGVDTTLVYRGDLFLRGFDSDIRFFIKSEIEKKGIKLRFNSDIVSISKNKDSGYRIDFQDGNSMKSGLVLYATGRVPHTMDLGLEKAGIELNSKSQIIIDEQFKTNVDSVYAIGDVVGRMQLTPVALAEGMYLSELFFGSSQPKPVDYTNIPTAVFCQPNIATIGLTEEEAVEKHKKIDVFVSDFKALKHTLSGRNERTFMKLIVDQESDKVVGAHMVGEGAGEIIQGVAIAIKAGATKADFDSTIGIHPTSAEEFVMMRQVRS